MTDARAPRGPAFVAGATGYTGREVVRVLRERGVDTVAHVRPDSPQRDDWRARFGELGARVDATPWQGDAMRDTLARLRPAWVFALLGTTKARERRARHQGGDASYETVDYGMSVTLLRAASASGARPLFVYLSAAGAGPRARGEYMAVRWRVEEEVRSSDLPWLIARPSFISGPDRDEWRPLERLGARLADAALLFAATFGGGAWRERYASAPADVVARGLVALALQGGGEGRVVGAEELRAAAGGEPPSYARDVSREVRDG